MPGAAQFMIGTINAEVGPIQEALGDKDSVASLTTDLWAYVKYLKGLIGEVNAAADVAGAIHAKLNAGNLIPVVGDTVGISYDAAVGTTNNTFYRLKDIKVTRTGVYRIKYDLKSGTEGQTVEAQIYRNGTAYGTLRSQYGAAFATYTQDLLFAAGDSVQVYGRSTSTHYVYVANFRICFDMGSVAGAIQ